MNETDQTTTETPSNPGESTLPPLYHSPILGILPEAERPNPSPACETCPAAVWFKTNGLLKCFCTTMHLLVWDKGDKKSTPIMLCDGREQAIMRMLEEMNKG